MSVTAFSIFAPAKLNLFLAVTGRRADGFHDLVSVVTKLSVGDTLHVTPADAFSFTCAQPEVPGDESNLVLKAARRFATATGWRGAAHFALEKRIPVGAGLGGGSSDGAAALLALNRMAAPSHALAADALARLAADLGSDCPLFLRDGPAVMRGRGELVTSLPPGAVHRLQGRRVLVFKPAFGIATPWAYAQLAADAPGGYLAPAAAERRLQVWLQDESAPAETLLFNNMEAPAFRKFPALPVLLDQLRNQFGLAPRMTGSGSACFALLRDGDDAVQVSAAVRAAWGDSAFIIEGRLA